MSYVYNYAIMHTGAYFVSWLACCSCINICRKDGSSNLCHTLHCWLCEVKATVKTLSSSQS